MVNKILFYTACFLIGMFIGYGGTAMILSTFVDTVSIPLNDIENIEQLDSPSYGISRLLFDEKINKGLDPLLLASVIEVESKWDQNAIGKLGELGLMQLHPKWHPLASLDPAENISMGASYLQLGILKCGGVEMGLRCYNGGINKRSLKKKRAIIYAKKVIKEYEEKKKRNQCNKRDECPWYPRPNPGQDRK